MEAPTTVAPADQSGGTNRSRAPTNVSASDLFSQLIVRKTARPMWKKVRWARARHGRPGAPRARSTTDGHIPAASGQASDNAMAQKADPRVAAPIPTPAEAPRRPVVGGLPGRQALEEGPTPAKLGQRGPSNGNFSAAFLAVTGSALGRDVALHPRFPPQMGQHEQKAWA